MEEQHAKKYIKTDDASRKKLCETIDRGSILNEAALTLGIPKVNYTSISLCHRRENRRKTQLF